MEFVQGEWNRAILEDRPDLPHGIVEIQDNNPLVCADAASLPNPAATLASIALAPLIQSGMLVERPALVFNFEVHESAADATLAGLGWALGARCVGEPHELGGVLALAAFAVVRSPDDLDEIDEAYEERYGRTFYVRRDEASEWSPALVAGRPFACYRLRITPDQPNSLLNVQVMADRNGKAGATQAVHLMNVMAGFEESLGIGG
jgi:N-acetyl-gamma-glutamylphosphate reductase